jgi:hypothetical protein
VNEADLGGFVPLLCNIWNNLDASTVDFKVLTIAQMT